MRVWVDAQLPPSLARWLTSEGDVQAVHVVDVDLLGAADSDIFDAARASGVHVVITKDVDFLNLLEHHGPPPQVVWVTCGNVRNHQLREIMFAAWPGVKKLLLDGEPLVEIGRRT